MRIDTVEIQGIYERHIEDYFWHHPEAITMKYTNTKIDSWLGRQVRVPSGIIDLLGITKEWGAGFRSVVVVELKNGPITLPSLAQVMRYAHDMEHLIHFIILPPVVDPDTIKIHRMVIGTEIDNTMLISALSMGIEPKLFGASMSINTQSVSWSKGYLDRHEKSLDSLLQSKAVYRLRKILGWDGPGLLKMRDDYLRKVSEGCVNER